MTQSGWSTLGGRRVTRDEKEGEKLTTSTAAAPASHSHSSAESLSIGDQEIRRKNWRSDRCTASSRPFAGSSKKSAAYHVDIDGGDRITCYILMRNCLGKRKRRPVYRCACVRAVYVSRKRVTRLRDASELFIPDFHLPLSPVPLTRPPPLAESSACQANLVRHASRKTATSRDEKGRRGNGKEQSLLQRNTLLVNSLQRDEWIRQTLTHEIDFCRKEGSRSQDPWRRR